MKKIILASGGSGGHIFPALALAEALSTAGYEPILLTDDRYKKFDTDANSSLKVHYIKSATMEAGVIGKAKTGYAIVVGVLQSRRLIKKIKPDVVIGFGGYPSFPTMFSADKLGIKTIIHEQNSQLGRANAMLANKVDVIATSFKNVIGIDESQKQKVCFTGNPVRKAIKAIREINYPDFTEGGMLRILVTGGSQGASVFSDVVPAAIAMLPKDMQARIRIDQQCRDEDISEVRQKYQDMNISADLSPFFNDIPSRLVSAHLVIARAGASTLAEISVAGRPVIMVPYPYAMDNHQRINATALEESGGGWLMMQEEFSAKTLSAKLESFLTLPDLLTNAAGKYRNLGGYEADKKLFELVDNLASNAGNICADNEAGELGGEEEINLSPIDKMESKG